jgi:hypothetical protein
MIENRYDIRKEVRLSIRVGEHSYRLLGWRMSQLHAGI